MFPHFTCFLISVPMFLIYILSAMKQLARQEQNTCEMTYMFEYPQYVRIQLQNDIRQQFPRYGLYSYGEGFAIAKIRTMHFTGIPVLFIPGNAGSHHQVRSLASVSFRKSQKDRTFFHFDFFTVDLHGEYSALYGGVLKEQIEFVSHCIQRILNFYAGKIDSVILIGHSMGGIVAKGVLLEPNINIKQVNTLIMLATPHRAALVMDTAIAALYQRIDEWDWLFKESAMITISIGGGPNDMLVNSNQVIDRIADINVLTTHIPGVWKSSDHRSILWCKEFVLSVIRALFDSVDATRRYPSISSDKQHRLKVFQYHLLQRSAGKKMGQYRTKMHFPPGGEWIEDIRRQYRWKVTDEIGHTNKSYLYLMIRLIGRQDRLTIQTNNLEVQDWLFACSASAIQNHSRVCEWGWNLTNKSRIFMDQRKKTVDLDLEELKARRLTHVVVRVPVSNLHKWLSIGVDLHEKSERNIQFKNELSSLNPLNWGSGKLGTIESSNGAIRYEVNLDSSIDTVFLKATNVKCNQHNYRHRAAVELLEPWTDGISQVRLLSYQNMTSNSVKLQTKHEVDEAKKNLTAKLKFTLDSECAYVIEVWHGGLLETVASAVRDRWQNLYGVTVGLLLVALAKQIDHDMGLIKSTNTIIVTFALCFGLGIGAESLVAFTILHISAVFICCTVVFLGSTVYSSVQRFLARVLRISITWSDWMLYGLTQLPLVATTILFAIVSVTCGAFAMILFIGLQLLKLIKSYEDYFEKLLLASLWFVFIDKFRERKENKSIKEQDETENETNVKEVIFQLLLFQVWCAAAIPAIPSLLTWVKNYRYSTRLTTEDPFLVVCWMVLMGCGSTAIKWLPPSRLEYYSQAIAILIRLLGWSALMITGLSYPQQYQYMMPLITAAAMIFLAMRPIIVN